MYGGQILALLSIYKEILGLNYTLDNSFSQFYAPMMDFGDDYDYDDDEEDDDYFDASHKNKDKGKDEPIIYNFDDGRPEVIGLPSIRRFLVVGGGKYVLSDFGFSKISFPVSKDFLKEYVDGWLLEKYPIAVKFTIADNNYQDIIKSKIALGYDGNKDLTITKFGYGYNTIFKNGFILYANSYDENEVQLVGAFKE